MLRRTILIAAGAWAARPAHAAEPTLLHVLAASSLADALTEIGANFESAHAGVRVQLASGGSGALLEQIAEGTPADVLASADIDSVVRGIERHLLLPDTQREFAGNAMVLVVPAASVLHVQRLSDLAQAEVQRIAMGRVASVAAGRYARQAIDAARLWPAVQRKIVGTGSARQALDLAIAGEVDAALVFHTDALKAGPRVRVVQTLSGHLPVRCTAAVASGSRQQVLARAYVLHLRSDAAKAVLQRLGFTLLSA